MMIAAECGNAYRGVIVTEEVRKELTGGGFGRLLYNETNLKLKTLRCNTFINTNYALPQGKPKRFKNGLIC